MSRIKAVFVYQDEWEGERFRAGVGGDVEVLIFPEGAEAVELDAASVDAHMVVGGGRVQDLDALRTYRNLRLVQVLSAGTNYLPTAKLAEMGVRVANNVGGNAAAVAEVTVVLMVSTYRHLMVQWNQTNNRPTRAQIRLAKGQPAQKRRRSPSAPRPSRQKTAEPSMTHRSNRG